MAITSSMAQKAGNISTAGSSRTCSDGGSRENKRGNSMPTTEGRVGLIQPICYGCG